MTSHVANLSLALAPLALAKGARTSTGALGYLRDLPPESLEEVRGLLTFRLPLIPDELRARAERLADLATEDGATQVRVDVPGCLRSPLEDALRRRNAIPLYDAGQDGILVEGGTGGAIRQATAPASRRIIVSSTSRATPPALPKPTKAWSSRPAS